MKKFTFLTFLSIAFVSGMILISSCTKEGPAGLTGVAGPQGPAGEDGINGTDGTAGCVACHDGGESQGMFSQSIQWENSVHATGGNFERNGEDCQTCHTSQGFLANLAGTYDYDVATQDPNPINCYTCHKIHDTYTPADLGFTTSTAVDLMNGGTFDMGKGNLCANCHQSRSLEGGPVIGGPDYTIYSPYWGGHHGPQGNVVAGTGFYEFSGSASYGTNQQHGGITNGCVDCHMANPYGVQAGGHTMSMTYAYHGSDAVWVEGCKECHGSSSTDANVLHAKIDVLQEEVENLLLELGNLLVTKNIIADAHAHRPIPGTYSGDVTAAFLNFSMIAEDRSLGVHNPIYVVALLENTIAAIE